MVNRKLVRPNLAQIKSQIAPKVHDAPPREASSNGSTARRRLAPPEQTSAEAFYYLKQMNTQTPMVVVLDNGDQVRGHIEWYDKGCLKVHRDGDPNILVYKHSIKYLYKQEEE